MKRLSTGVLAALLTAGLGLNAVAAPTSASHGNIGTNAIAQSGGAMDAPPANFGSPPSGQIPILFNDHHVYAKPDVLKQGRVLAALVRGGTVLIPLRSMFEQMGATVSYDAFSKTVDVSKPGADVKVTVGKPEVVINGESRPLDVPPIMYQGHVLVPVRVISEGMGAYVQWVPDKQLVVVRYIPPTPPPTPTPPPPPPPATAAADADPNAGCNAVSGPLHRGRLHRCRRRSTTSSARATREQQTAAGSRTRSMARGSSISSVCPGCWKATTSRSTTRTIAKVA